MTKTTKTEDARSLPKVCRRMVGLDALHDACGWTIPEAVRFYGHDRAGHPVLKLGMALVRCGAVDTRQ